MSAIFSMPFTYIMILSRTQFLNIILLITSKFLLEYVRSYCVLNNYKIKHIKYKTKYQKNPFLLPDPFSSFTDINRQEIDVFSDKNKHKAKPKNKVFLWYILERIENYKSVVHFLIVLLFLIFWEYISSAVSVVYSSN